MTYTDEYGTWKLLGEILLSQQSKFISVPAVAQKTIRFSYQIDWVEWEKSVIFQSRCRYRWHYGLNREIHGFYNTLYPTKTSHVKSFDLIAKGSLVPRELEFKLIPMKYRYYYHNVELLPWTLKVEEFQND